MNLLCPQNQPWKWWASLETGQSVSSQVYFMGGDESSGRPSKVNATHFKVGFRCQEWCSNSAQACPSYKEQNKTSPGYIKGIFHAKMCTIKDRNGKDLTEAAAIKGRWQEYTELYEKGLNDPDNYNGVAAHLEPNILKSSES